jgi:hypothetical protein
MLLSLVKIRRLMMCRGSGRLGHLIVIFIEAATGKATHAASIAQLNETKVAKLRGRLCSSRE